MRKVVLYTLMSVDGAAEDPSRYLPEFDSVLGDLEARLIGEAGRGASGPQLVRGVVRLLAEACGSAVADFINNVKKYVVTSRPLTSSWGDVEAVSDPIEQFVRDLKAQPDAEIGVHGSIQLAQSLLAAGLVDELQLAVGPVLDPTGRRLLEPLDSPGSGGTGRWAVPHE